MTDLFGNAGDLIEQGGEFLKKPAVQGLFTQLTSWVGSLLTRNNKAKEQLEKAKKSDNDMAALKANLDFMEKWNSEMQTELEAKAKEIESFTKQAGLDLSGSFNVNSITGNTVTTMNGNMVAGSGHKIGNSNQFDIDSLVYAVKKLKQGDTVDELALVLKLDKEVLLKLEHALK